MSVHGRFEPGTRLGKRYRIVGLLGRGGMGEVYRADDLELGQSVALKFLPERVAADPVALDRFRNEVRTAREVAHPNVCRMYDIAEEDGHVFLSMEYVDGEDLASVLRRLGRPSREKAIEIARQICLGLAAAHENSVLHRDLKPANIMIDGRGRVRITDFGLAGFIEKLERGERVAGTPAYMAPEQLAEGKVSVRSDIYTLGLILYELFTGKRAFEIDNVEELKRKHTSGSVSTPSSISEEIDPAVDRVITRCLQHQAEQRPQSVYQVLAALPGGDPLAAALAAGETPSPELVANARDAGGLRPAVALTLLALCFAPIILHAAVTDAYMPKPAKGPGVLAVEAAQAMERLGHTNLPQNSAARYEPIWRGRQSASNSDADESNSDGPAKYRYWRRWANGSLLPSNFHRPFAVGPDDPPMSQPGDAVVYLTAKGRLLSVDVIPDQQAEPIGETDWHAALDLSGIELSGVQPTEPIGKPRRPVDEVRAWSVNDWPGAVVQAGAVGGRIVHYEVFREVAEGRPQSRDGRQQRRRERFSLRSETIETASSVRGYLSIVANVVMIVLAVQNVRLRRSDLRGALRVALVIVGLELMIEALAVRVHERTLLGHLQQFFGGRSGGHILQHGVDLFIAYLAIEPYLRRLMPRVLVGTMRLVSGRFTDPLVGREILIGSLVGIWLPTTVGLTLLLTDNFPGRMGRVHAPLLTSVSIQLTHNLVSIAWGMVFTFTFAVLLVFGRIVLRNNVAALVVASVYVVLQFLQFLQWLAFLGDSMDIATIAVIILIAAVIGLTGVRSGLVSVVFAFAVFHSFGNLTFSLKLGEWYSVHTVLSAAFVLTFPIIGCWLSLAGQPLFEDVLAEPQAKG